MRNLGLLRGLAILGAVAYHSSTSGMFAMSCWSFRVGYNGPTPDLRWVGTVDYYIILVIAQLGLLAVPAFLFASGFFVAYATHCSTSRITTSIISGWLRSLLHPYLAWIAVAVGLYLLAAILSPSTRLLGWDGLAGFVWARAVDEYHFVLLLCALFILAPAIVWMTHKHPILVLGGFALVHVIFAAPQSWHRVGLRVLETLDFMHLAGGLLPSAWRLFFELGLPFYFVLGVVVARHHELLKRLLVDLRWFAIAATVLFWMLSVLEADSAFSSNHTQWNAASWTLSSFFYSTSIILAVVAMNLSRGQFLSTLEQLGTHSYGIYLVHFIVIQYAMKCTYHLAPWILFQQLLLQPLLIASSIALPMIMMATVSRSPLRKYHRAIFGSPPSVSKRTFMGGIVPAGKFPAKREPSSRTAV